MVRSMATIPSRSDDQSHIMQKLQSSVRYDVCNDMCEYLTRDALGDFKPLRRFGLCGQVMANLSTKDSGTSSLEAAYRAVTDKRHGFNCHSAKSSGTSFFILKREFTVTQARSMNGSVKKRKWRLSETQNLMCLHSGPRRMKKSLPSWLRAPAKPTGRRLFPCAFCFRSQRSLLLR